TVSTVTAVNGNTLTLSHPYHGPTLAAGTAVAPRNSGGTYQYQLLYGYDAPLTWTHKTSPPFNYMRSGTDTVRLIALLYSGSSLMTGFEFWEGTDTQRPQFYYRSDGSTAVFTQTAQSAPKKLSVSTPTTITVGQRGPQYFDST